MQYRTLGQSGVKVSPLCLGTMMFGGPTEEAAAHRIIDAAADQGVNFIDTANVYEGGRSEEIVGRGIAARRRHWVLATKLANPAGPGPNDRGLSRRHAMDAVEHLPACAAFGLGVFPYSPLARGVLTGKYRPDAQPDRDSRAGRQDKRIMETEFRPESLRIAQRLAEHAGARGITPGQFAVAWVLNNALVTGLIAGPRTEEQWADYAGALDYRFTAEDEALVDSLVPAGHPSTPGYNDPAYPLEGRVPRAAP